MNPEKSAPTGVRIMFGNWSKTCLENWCRQTIYLFFDFKVRRKTSKKFHPPNVKNKIFPFSDYKNICRQPYSSFGNATFAEKKWRFAHNLPASSEFRRAIGEIVTTFYILPPIGSTGPFSRLQRPSSRRIYILQPKNQTGIIAGFGINQNRCREISWIPFQKKIHNNHSIQAFFGPDGRGIGGKGQKPLYIETSTAFAGYARVNLAKT